MGHPCILDPHHQRRWSDDWRCSVSWAIFCRQSIFALDSTPASAMPTFVLREHTLRLYSGLLCTVSRQEKHEACLCACGASLPLRTFILRRTQPSHCTGLFAARATSCTGASSVKTMSHDTNIHMMSSFDQELSLTTGIQRFLRFFFGSSAGILAYGPRRVDC